MTRLERAWFKRSFSSSIGRANLSQPIPGGMKALKAGTATGVARLCRPAAGQCHPHFQQARVRLRGRESRQGWSFTIYEEAWNDGFHAEMAHFVSCVRDDRQPLCTGEDGKAVLEAIFAAYASAAEGRRIDLPFATHAQCPIDLWKRG